MTTFNKYIADSELLIVGHGSSKSEESTILIKNHTKAIKDQNIFKDVRCGFLKLEPFLIEQLNAMKSNLVHIVPCFSGAGSLTKSVIPIWFIVFIYSSPNVSTHLSKNLYKWSIDGYAFSDINSSH